jgi:DNA-3-methyladenine glycosylase I
LFIRDRVGWDLCIRDSPRPARMSDVPATTPESIALAKRLRKLRFKFVGPTTAYAMMQAAGMVNDHVEGCHVVIA